MFSVHVQSLTHDSEVAQGLQHNWDGGEHCQLVSRSCVPLHTSCPHCVLGSSDSVMSSFLPLPATLLFRQCPVRSHHLLVVTLCPVLLGRHQPFLPVPQRPLLVHRNQPILSVLLFQQFPKCLVRRLLLPTRLWLCILVALQHLRAVVVVDLSQKQDLHEMSLDNYYATVSEMVSLGQFEHGHATVCFGMGSVAPSGSLAHSSGQASSPPLWCPLPRCESHTVVSRSCRRSSVSPSTVRELDVCFSSSTSLGSVKPCLAVPPLDDPHVPDSRVVGGGPSPCQRETARLNDVVSQMRTQLASRPHASPLVPQAPPPLPAPPVPPPPPTPPSVGGNSPLCRHAGCSNAVSASCPVRFCQMHCTTTYTGPRLVRVAIVACVVATPLSPDLVPAASALCIAPVCYARFIGGVSQCVPLQIVLLLRALLALSALVRRIVLVLNVLEVVKILLIILGHLVLHVHAH